MLFKQTEWTDMPNRCTWCPGCGNFGIWAALRSAAAQAQWDNANSVIVAGIGCHGHIVNFVPLTTFEGLHGRPIPVASGIKMANHKLHVFVVTGDGDCLAEGGNHFIHAARRNQNITVILHDNAIYGLTTGQTSPRSPQKFVSKSTPFGNIEEPIHPLQLAFTTGATFLARGYAGNIPQLTELLVRADRHRGFSVVQILQPCVTFNHLYTHAFYQENTYAVDKAYDPTDKSAAFAKLLEWGEHAIPLGVLYEDTASLCYEEQLPQIKRKSLVKQGVRKRSIANLMKRFC